MVLTWKLKLLRQVLPERVALTLHEVQVDGDPEQLRQDGMQLMHNTRTMAAGYPPLVEVLGMDPL